MAKCNENGRNIDLLLSASGAELDHSRVAARPPPPQLHRSQSLAVQLKSLIVNSQDANSKGREGTNSMEIEDEIQVSARNSRDNCTHSRDNQAGLDEADEDDDASLKDSDDDDGNLMPAEEESDDDDGDDDDGDDDKDEDFETTQRLD